jgi:hypothetical protein
MGYSAINLGYNLDSISHRILRGTGKTNGGDMVKLTAWLFFSLVVAIAARLSLQPSDW